MKQPIVTMFVALGMTIALAAHATDSSDAGASLAGRVYPTGANASTPAFTVERHRKTSGETSVLTERFKDMDGTTAALLKSTYQSGSLQSIEFEQNQTKESASALFRDGKVFFTQTVNGGTKKTDQTVDGKWVALSAVPDEIVSNWDSVTAGKPLEFAMPVPIMRDHFAFTVAKQRSWTENGRRLTEFRMQPSSIVIRMMADAFYYVFDDESRSLVEFRGVTIAKANDNGKWKDLNARIAYQKSAAGK